MEENEIWTEIDEKGRQEPCCEYFSISDERHDDKEFLDFAWEDYYKAHEDQRPQTDIELWRRNMMISLKSMWLMFFAWAAVGIVGYLIGYLTLAIVLSVIVSQFSFILSLILMKS